jgi:hypothetical protein
VSLFALWYSFVMTEMAWRGDWVAVEAPARRIDAKLLSVAFVAAAGATAWFVLANTFDVVRQFGGSLQSLGGAAAYASSLPTLIAWSLVLVAVLAVLPGAPSQARRGLRIGVFALVTGAVLEVLGALCSVWEASVTHGQVVLQAATINEALDLLRASSVFGVLALFAFAAGALLVRPARTVAASREASDHSSIWRAAAAVIAVALVVGSLQQCYLLVTLFASAPPPYQVETLLSGLPPACMWFGLTWSLLLISRGVSRSPRLVHLRSCIRLGMLGTALLGAASLLQLVYYEVALAQTNSSLLELLTRASSISNWLAWLTLTAGFCVAAARVLSPNSSGRQALRALVTSQRPALVTSPR